MDPNSNVNIHNLSQLAESLDVQDYRHRSTRMQQK